MAVGNRNGDNSRELLKDANTCLTAGLGMCKVNQAATHPRIGE